MDAELQGDLDAFREGEEPPWDEEPQAPPDVGRVQAMLWRLRRLNRDRRDVNVLYEQQREQLDAWHEARAGLIDRQMDWLRRSLAAYHEGVYAQQKTATLSFPAGVLKSRKVQPQWVYDDEEKFLAWAREHAPECVRKRPDEIDKNAAKARLTQERGKRKDYGVTADGERPPGMHVVVPPESARTFTVEIGTEEPF
jgi:hypothetical protein